MTQPACRLWWVGYVWHHVGTKNAPESRHRTGLAFVGFLRRYVFDFLIRQRLHEAFFVTKKRESGDVHALQLFQSFSSFTHRESALCQCAFEGGLVVAIHIPAVGFFPTNCIFTLLCIVPYVR